MKERVIRYKGKDIIVTFLYYRCTHYSACLKGAPDVFDLSQEPWVIPDAESADKIAEVIERCPTGALHYIRLDGGDEETVPAENVIRIAENGPLYIHGDLEIRDEKNNLLISDTRIALCRCGKSENAFLCDGQHKFQGLWSEGTFGTGERPVEKAEMAPGKLVITVMPDGPFLIQGPVMIKDQFGAIRFQGTQTALCRCGKSKRKPFCDGSHAE